MSAGPMNRTEGAAAAPSSRGARRSTFAPAGEIGELHFEIIVHRMKREYDVQARAGMPTALRSTTVNGSIDKAVALPRSIRVGFHEGQDEPRQARGVLRGCRGCAPHEQGSRFHVEEYDDAHSMDEDRWITTASHPSDRRIVLSIVWTFRATRGSTITRIIGAPSVTRRERKSYEDEIASR